MSVVINGQAPVRLTLSHPPDRLAAITSVTAGLAAHLADTADAHDASAVSVLDTAGNFTATDVEGVLAELPSRFAPFALDGGTPSSTYDGSTVDGGTP
jgi:hypothetical protein